MKKVLFIMVISVLALGLISISVYYSMLIQSKDQINFLHKSIISSLDDELKQKDASIESLNKRVLELERQVLFLSNVTHTGTLTGRITFSSGNCMPAVCDNPPCETGCVSGIAVSRNVYIREIAAYADIEGYYLKETEKPQLVAMAKSDVDGFYTVVLPVGEYSFFVDDGGKEYCASFDGQNACVVKIEDGKYTEYDQLIDHASY